jgi:DNA invertase Pin-like site-specific DNA recombinase
MLKQNEETPRTRPVVNVAFYVRGMNDKKDGSIDAQIGLLTSLVEHRRTQGQNWVTQEKLVDAGKSAYHTDRPGYRRLLKLVRSRRVDVVAITRLDRISRNITDFVKLVGELDRHGVRLVSLRERIDLTSPIRWLSPIRSFCRTAEKRRPS